MESGNASVVLSTLIFSPVPDDHGKILKCRGENPALTDAYLEDFFKLNVVCKWRAVARNFESLLFYTSRGAWKIYQDCREINSSQR